MVASVAPEPVSISTAVAGYRPQRGFAESRPSAPLQEDPLPPVPTPVPAPVPQPVEQPPSQAFAAALVVADQPPRPADALDALRFKATWTPPASDLSLTDRLV